MAKGNDRPAAAKRRTGKYFICPCSGLLHEHKVANAITRGAKGWAASLCTACRTQVILGIDWQDNMGLTEEQARALGAEIRI